MNNYKNVNHNKHERSDKDMEKYEKILNLFKQLTKELNSLNKFEFNKLMLALEFSIWQDKVKELEKGE